MRKRFNTGCLFHGQFHPLPIDYSVQRCSVISDISLAEPPGGAPCVRSRLPHSATERTWTVTWRSNSGICPGNGFRHPGGSRNSAITDSRRRFRAADHRARGVLLRAVHGRPRQHDRERRAAGDRPVAAHRASAGLQWTIAGYTIVLASLLMFSGAAADRIGRRTIFQVGLSACSPSAPGCAASPRSLALADRVPGAAGDRREHAQPGGPRHHHQRLQRGRRTGPRRSASGTASPACPWRSVPSSAGSWSAPSAGAGSSGRTSRSGLAAVALTALLVPDSRADRGRKADPVGQFLVIVMLASLAVRDHPGPDRRLALPRYRGFLLRPLPALAVLVPLRAAARRTADRLPLLPQRSRSPRPTPPAVCAIAALAGFLFLTTLYLQDVRGFSRAARGPDPAADAGHDGGLARPCPAGSWPAAAPGSRS